MCFLHKLFWLILKLTRKWSSWKFAPGRACKGVNLSNYKLWSHCHWSWWSEHTLLPRYFTFRNEYPLFKNITRVLGGVPEGPSYLFLETSPFPYVLCVSYSDTIFFRLYSVILMQFFWNFTDLHGQQQTLSLWPQNPQGLMDFSYPTEVMQIAKTHPGSFVCPFLLGRFVHIQYLHVLLSSRPGICFCSWRAWTSTCIRTPQVHQPLLNPTLDHIIILNGNKMRDPAALSSQDQVMITTSSEAHKPWRTQFLVVHTT